MKMWPNDPGIRRYDASSALSADSSRSRKNSSPRAPYNKALLSSQLKRRQIHGRVLHTPKKHQQSVDDNEAQQPNYKSSSLNHSLATSRMSSTDSPDPKQQTRGQKPQGPLPPYLTLKRQPTAAMLNFRARKSVSQMDFKEARRTGNWQLVASEKRDGQLTIRDKSLSKMLLHDAAQLCTTEQGDVRIVVNSDQDVRIASLRIFNTIMLRSWRRRREEVRLLSDRVEDFKRSFVKNRNQLHVYNTLFAVEKRRNETLNDQLKQSYVDCAKTKLSHNEMSILLSQTNREKEQLAQDYACKKQEAENVQELLEATKRELFQSNAQLREQLEKLTSLQLECQAAKFKNEELTVQLQSLKSELDKKQQSVEHLRGNIALIAGQLTQDKCNAELQIGKLTQYKEKLEQEMKQKEEQLITLQNCLAATVGQRIRQCFVQSQAYQHATYRLMHFFAYYMLPGTPPPALPMSTIPSAVKKLRGFFSPVTAPGIDAEGGGLRPLLPFNK